MAGFLFKSPDFGLEFWMMVEISIRSDSKEIDSMDLPRARCMHQPRRLTRDTEEGIYSLARCDRCGLMVRYVSKKGDDGLWWLPVGEFVYPILYRDLESDMVKEIFG